MNDFSAFWKDIMIGSFFCMMIIVYADFIRNPEKYGEIMQKYDEARFPNYEEIE